MDILELLISVFTGLSSFFSTAAVLIFLHCFHDSSYRWTGKKAALIFLFSIVGNAIVGIFGYACLRWLLPLFLLSDYFIITHDYPQKKIRGYLRYLAISLCVTFSIAIITEFGAIVLLEHYLKPYESMLLSDPENLILALSLMNDVTAITNIVTLSIQFFCALFFALIFCYLYFKLYRRGIVMRCQKWYYFFLALYPLLCLAFLTIFAFVGINSSITLFILAGMSILFALAIPLFVYYSRISRYFQEKTAFQENYIQAELAHFTQYKQAQEETARFRHDIRNNLLCVNQMLQAGKTSEASEYLNDLLQTTDTLRQKYVTGDEMLDCIVGFKAGIMEEKNIPFRLDGVLAGGLPWKPMDLCIVFANALDNAMEACMQLPEDARYIDLTIRSTAQYWFISIENPVLHDVDVRRLFQKNGSYTSKTDADQHGIGTYNMKHTVERNNGILQAHCQDQRFTLEIMIDKSGC